MCDRLKHLVDGSDGVSDEIIRFSVYITIFGGTRHKPWFHSVSATSHMC